MRTTESSQAQMSIACNGEIQAALDLMNNVMNVDITHPKWEWLKGAGNCLEPIIADSHEKGALAATTACYPFEMKVGPESIERVGIMGQLVSAKSTSMRKRGTAVDLLIWSEKQLLNQGITHIMGFFGEKIYPKFHRRLLGYPATHGTTLNFRQFSQRYYCRRLCERINTAGIPVPRLTVLFVDSLGQKAYLVLCPEKGATVQETPAKGGWSIGLQGITWPLLRYVVDGKAKKTLLDSLVSLRLRLRVITFLLHPVKHLRFALFLRTLHASVKNGERTEENEPA